MKNNNHHSNVKQMKSTYHRAKGSMSAQSGLSFIERVPLHFTYKKFSGDYTIFQ